MHVKLIDKYSSLALTEVEISPIWHDTIKPDPKKTAAEINPDSDNRIGYLPVVNYYRIGRCANFVPINVVGAICRPRGHKL